jgi:hypothetical protein
MALHRDRVELNPVPLFAKCKLLVRQNSDALMQIVDDRDGNLLAQINTVSVMEMGKSLNLNLLKNLQVPKNISP